MEEKHTPGPWFSEDAGRQRDGAIAVFAEEGVACVAFIERGCLPLDEDGRDARWANARLIAQAPDLLALVHQYRNDMLYPPAGDSRERRVKAIDAVLAKVSGS